MLQDILPYYNELPKASAQNLLKLSSEHHFKKGDIVIKIGDTTQCFYYIKKGLVRSVFTNEEGKEYTRSFITQSNSFASPETLFTKKPSALNYECLVDCVLYKIKFDEFIELSKKDIQIAFLYNKILEKYLMDFLSKIYDLSVLDASERFEKLKKNIPHIEDIIPQYQIASYLNITPVQLSRIKKKLYLK